jgi:hypothetical protein
MSLLDRVLGVPSWANVLDRDGFAALSAELDAALRARGLPGAGRKGTVKLDDGPLHFGTLARKCQLFPRLEWAALIADHLDVAVLPATSFDKLMGDLQRARLLLRVQLVTDDLAAPDSIENVNVRRFSPGVLVTLQLEHPRWVSAVTAEQVRSWDRPFEELLETASENVRRDLAPVMERDESHDLGCVIHRLIGDSFFVGSHALWIDRFAEARGDRGTLVSIPARSVLQFHAIRDASVWSALDLLAVAGVNLHARLPVPLTTDVFWIFEGRHTRIPVNTRLPRMQAEPGQDFVEAMAGLPAA